MKRLQVAESCEKTNKASPPVLFFILWPCPNVLMNSHWLQGRKREQFFFLKKKDMKNEQQYYYFK